MLQQIGQFRWKLHRGREFEFLTFTVIKIVLLFYLWPTLWKIGMYNLYTRSKPQSCLNMVLAPPTIISSWKLMQNIFPSKVWWEELSQHVFARLSLFLYTPQFSILIISCWISIIYFSPGTCFEVYTPNKLAR